MKFQGFIGNSEHVQKWTVKLNKDDFIRAWLRQRSLKQVPSVGIINWDTMGSYPRSCSQWPRLFDHIMADMQTNMAVNKVLAQNELDNQVFSSQSSIL